MEEKYSLAQLMSMLRIIKQEGEEAAISYYPELRPLIIKIVKLTK